MTKTTVILINRAIPSHVVGSVTGFSGMKYASSYYESAYGGSVARMDLEAYRAARRDIAMGCARPLSQWEIDFEGEALVSKSAPTVSPSPDSKANQPAPTPVAPVTDESIPESTPEGNASDLERAAYWERIDAAVSSAPSYTAESLAPLNYFKLKKIARDAGIDPETFTATEPLRVAILAKQEAR